MKSKLFIILFIITITSSVCFSQCDEDIVPSSNKKLKYRDWGSYCEGFFKANVGSLDMKLVQFTIGEFNYKGLPNESVVIKSGINFENNFKIKANGVPFDLFYQMDAVLKKSKDSLNWKVKNILIRNSRTKNYKNIGIYGYYLESNSIKIYSPVKTYSSIKNADLTSKSNRYIIKLISNTRLDSIRWKILGTNFKEKKIDGSFRSEKIINLMLPESIKSGTYNIKVKARQININSEWVIKRFKIAI